MEEKRKKQQGSKQSRSFSLPVSTVKIPMPAVKNNSKGNDTKKKKG